MNLHNTCSTAAHDSIGQELSKEAVEKEKEKIRKNEKIEKERERREMREVKEGNGRWQHVVNTFVLYQLKHQTPRRASSCIHFQVWLSNMLEIPVFAS